MLTSLPFETRKPSFDYTSPPLSPLHNQTLPPPHHSSRPHGTSHSTCPKPNTCTCPSNQDLFLRSSSLWLNDLATHPLSNLETCTMSRTSCAHSHAIMNGQFHYYDMPLVHPLTWMTARATHMARTGLLPTLTYPLHSWWGDPFFFFLFLNKHHSTSFPCSKLSEAPFATEYKCYMLNYGLQGPGLIWPLPTSLCTPSCTLPLFSGNACPL